MQQPPPPLDSRARNVGVGGLREIWARLTRDTAGTQACLAESSCGWRMTVVNMLDAKSTLSRLVDTVESGAEREIIIIRNGKPMAKLVPIGAPVARGPRIGGRLGA